MTNGKSQIANGGEWPMAKGKWRRTFLAFLFKLLVSRVRLAASGGDYLLHVCVSAPKNVVLTPVKAR